VKRRGASPDTGDLLVKTEIMGQILAVALHCDLTRVFSFMLTSPATTHVFGNLGVGNDMHKTCHDGAVGAGPGDHRLSDAGFAKLLDQLAKLKDAMDRPWSTARASSGCRSTARAGSTASRRCRSCSPARPCGGNLVRGVHVREPGGNISKAHVTMLRALGIDTPSFGWNGGETTEHLTGILA
jgi:hypothetical protein